MNYIITLTDKQRKNGYKFFPVIDQKSFSLEIFIDESISLLSQIENKTQAIHDLETISSYVPNYYHSSNKY